MSSVPGRRRDERGAILIIAAVGMVVAMIAAGLAVDLGRIASDARTDQKVADLAALDAVRALSAGVIDQSQPGSVTQAAKDAAVRNGFTDTVDVDWADPVTGLFTNNPLLLATPGLVQSVRVTTTSPHTNAFPFLGGRTSVTRKAVATNGNGSGCTLPELCVRTDGTPIGTAKVGSTLASVTTENIILNKLLTQTVGGSYSLDAAGWQGLAAGQVSFKRLRTALGYSTGTTDSVLDANFTYRQILNATIAALNADGSPTNVNAATKLASIASQVGAAAGATMTLREFFDITGNVGSGKDVADASMNVKDIVVGGMTLADTDHFAALHLTAADIPGLPGNYVDVKFGLIEAPQVKSGPPRDSSGYRTIAHTGQIRLQVTVNLTVSVVGIGLLDVNVPYYIEIGAADAKLDTLTCTVGVAVPTAVSILGTTNVGKVVVGTVADAVLSNPATMPVPALTRIVNALGITLDANSIGGVTVTLAGNPGDLKSFAPPYTATTPASQHIAAGGAFSLPSLTAANTTTAGGGALNGLVSTTVLSAVGLVVSPLTTTLLNPMFKGLGLSYAGADIWAPPPQSCNPTSFNTDPGGNVFLTVPSLVS